MDDQTALNTDQEIWREFTGNAERGDYIFVTGDGGIGMNVGGHVIVKPLREWFDLAREKTRHIRCTPAQS
jgi:hypothetical protein